MRETETVESHSVSAGKGERALMPRLDRTSPEGPISCVDG
jgi:hypothetical protein